MKIQKLEEAIMMPTEDLEKTGINPSLFWAYINSREAGNEIINFEETVWGGDIEPICKELEEYGVRELTISTNSYLLEMLAAFEIHGWVPFGAVEVSARYKDWSTGKNRTIPAIELVKEE